MRVVARPATVTGPPTPAEVGFREALEAMDAPQVLEVGGRDTDGRETHHRSWAPDAGWINIDLEPGGSVDMLGDAHALPAEWSDHFDAYVAGSVWEHLQRPWIAAMEAGRVLRPGGVLYVATHQTFVLHAYPYDFFRFSKEALTTIFEDVGLRVIRCGYANRCQVVPDAQPAIWDASAFGYLNVDIFAIKPEANNAAR